MLFSRKNNKFNFSDKFVSTFEFKTQNRTLNKHVLYPRRKYENLPKEMEIKLFTTTQC